MQNTLQKVFGEVLVKKQAFRDNRNMDFQKGNLDIFLEGILHDLGPFGEKDEFFCLFYFYEK